MQETKSSLTQKIRNIRAPCDLGIYPDRLTETVAFLGRIRKAFDEGYDEIIVNLSRCSTISRAASVMLAARLDVGVEQSTAQVTVVEPKDTALRLQLAHLGFYKHFNVESSFTEEEIKAASSMGAILTSGVGIDGLGALSVQVANLVQNLFEDAQYRNRALQAIDEAMENIVHHAYPDGSPKAWWLCGLVDRQASALLIYAFDHGAGIPHRAPITMKEPLVETMKAAGANTKKKLKEHGRILAAAIECDRALLDGYGKGLQKMFALVKDESREGAVQLVSSRGSYRLTKTDKEPVNIQWFTTRRNLPGTLVVWSIKGPVIAGAPQ